MDGFKNNSNLYLSHPHPITISRLLHFWISSTRKNIPGGCFGILPEKQGVPLELFGETELRIEFSRIVSKFLMDRERAGFFCVNSQKYADLARRLLEILCDKWVYNLYTLICAHTKAWIHSRRFTDIVNVNWIQLADSNSERTRYYDVGKLAFNLLPILLSRIKALGGSQVHEVTILLLIHPAFI